MVCHRVHRWLKTRVKNYLCKTFLWSSTCHGRSEKEGFAWITIVPEHQSLKCRPWFHDSNVCILRKFVWVTSKLSVMLGLRVYVYRKGSCNDYREFEAVLPHRLLQVLCVLCTAWRWTYGNRCACAQQQAALSQLLL